MGRLAGFSGAEVIRRLRRAGFVFDRQAKGSHEIWLHPQTRRRTTIPNHPGALPEGTVRAIIREAALSVDEFLAFG
ncbi:MAG TPA: type II toxin-antitoxin system HicA family toxin [Armatimonadota bacterium]|nr:type II toxin-antitoxin system HicA family toxin [Armatimonadota bacterium]